jgi:sirohydrochlorin cobaltochelatase
VGQDDFADAALVLLGHGSTLDAGAGAPVWQHAASLRLGRQFGEAREAFWKQEPRVAGVLAKIALPRVFVVPLFISEGFFSDVVIPRELGVGDAEPGKWPRIRRSAGQTLFYCQPVGTHPGMGALVLDRAREVVARFPFPRAPRPQDTALFVAGHGTSRNPSSRLAIERQADWVRGLDLYAEVHAAFLEEEPRIARCWRRTAAKHAVVVPFFIGDGPHVRADIPVMLGESERRVRERLGLGQTTWRNPTEREGRLIWLSASVGSHPELANVILARVEDALRPNTAALLPSTT